MVLPVLRLCVVERATGTNLFDLPNPGPHFCRNRPAWYVIRSSGGRGHAFVFSPTPPNLTPAPRIPPPTFIYGSG
ncbi:MAG: hypothetical protein AVDCRST_MAG56-7059 [uncultured Cytophagales bacterium]|uniref:Uncharacterized protein n=1 Tax=uncultured Cytophagales bacterium TaxID=158755 RepID=A0A6J4L551_9SPHI|nr:MAG: hypothetical protein AVDCRST_MAG56-7059 [uncultured Cytophagales bacterium]